MKCHLIHLKGKCERYAGTGADARTFRNAIMEEFNVPKKKVLIQPTEIPTQKDALIEFINNLLARIDKEVAHVE
jgi:hypothetical protein